MFKRIFALLLVVVLVALAVAAYYLRDRTNLSKTYKTSPRSKAAIK
ncbi:MAG: hypothetical protein CM15mP68_5780 [Pseudomonadota bacterium]|nr:MAG: hypothetical protein CM15mP68_5780 [Pseudomonadota bacterium]